MKITTILLIIGIITLSACTAPPDDANRAEILTGNTIELEGDFTEVPINIEESSFRFIGYGPGKSHEGTFNEMLGVLLYEGDTLVGARGTIKAESVDTDSDGLDRHLRNEDFFNVDIYPTIEVETVLLESDNVVADLTFHGVTKRMSFPVTTTENSISGETILKMSDFEINYPAVNDEVSIGFTFTT